MISFNKMIHFTRLVKINGRLREFNYRKNNTAGKHIFDVDTADDRGNRVFFRLNKDNGDWELTSNQNLPDWILNSQEQLVTELEEGMNENN
ncbi:MAG: hypothetical protein ACK5NK_01590 [Niabella sp.]